MSYKIIYLPTAACWPQEFNTYEAALADLEYVLVLYNDCDVTGLGAKRYLYEITEVCNERNI